jgi:ABC-type branched-subunit amino acid transport system ATPase component
VSAALEVRNLTVRFGGLLAVSELSLSVPEGAITALIGPNGAGKTTTFGACSGLVRPAAGSVHLFGEDVTSVSVAARGRRGIARTFQRMQLFDSLTVAENVAMGREASLAGRGLRHHLGASRSERADIAHHRDAILHSCGLTEVQDELVAKLPTGLRRTVELARALAAAPRLLLLDEPSSGLDEQSSKDISLILREEVRNNGTAVLLVEHDMAFVNELSERVYVLDFGQLIFEGSMPAALTSEIVREAYLGKEPVATSA